jgi:hypothetical protein
MNYFKNFMLDVFRPMQQKALAEGKNPADVDVSGAMQSYVGSRVADEARGEIRGMETGLAKRGLGLRERSLGLKRSDLDLRRKQIGRGKKMAPWATGLGVANVGLSGLQGWQELEEARKNRLLIQKYLTDIRGMGR